MFKKLFAFLPEYPSDEHYFRFEQELSYKNAQHIYTFSLLIALAALTLFGLPFGEHLLTNTPFAPNYGTLFELSGLFLLVLFMFSFRAYASRIRQKSAISNRRRLRLGFTAALLFPAFIISLGQHTSETSVSIFLVAVCLLLVGLYWPLNRALVVSYMLLTLYYVFIALLSDSWQLPAFFYIPHLIFPALFYVLARHIIHLKVSDMESLGRIEAQAQALRQNNRMMLQQRHTLENAGQHLHEGLFRIGKKRGLLYANDALAKLLGFLNAEKLLALEERHSVFSPEQLRTISNKVNQQGFAQGLEFMLQTSKQQRLWAEVSCMVYPDEASGELLFEGSLSDISFRKKAMQEALINATRLEQAETVAGTGFFDMDLSSGKVTLSKGCAKLFNGLPDNPYSLSTFLDFIHPKDRDTLRQHLLESLANYQGFNLTFQLKVEPENRYLSCKAAMISDTTDKRMKLLATVQDVTEVELQASLLARSEAYIRAAFQHNHFGILLYNEEERILEYNLALQLTYRRLFGASLSEGLSLNQVISENDYQHLSALFSSTLQGSFHKIEYCFYNDRKDPLWAELNFSPVIAPNGKIIGGLLMLSDVTERKQGEQLIEMLSHLASDSGSPMLLTNAQGQIEWANAAFCKLSHYSQQELQRLPLDKLLQIGDAERPISSQLASTFSYRGEGRLCKNNENTTCVFLTANPLHLNQANSGKFVWVLTEMDEADYQLEKKQSALETTKSQLLRQEAFLSAVSHELRTPLNAVIGMAYHLLENKPRPDQEEDLEILCFSAKHLLTLINDILDMSKLEAGKVSIHQAPFNLREVLSSLKKTFQPQAEAKQLQFKMLLRDEVPDWLVGDRQRFIQIVTNLLSNAFKFTAAGSIRLTIQAVPFEPGRCRLEVSVQDTGKGIPADKLHTVFDRYEQLNTENAPQGGTGLGLAITKQLLELQEGEISAESTPGKGSTFRFSLPMGIAASPAAEVAQQATTSEPELMPGMKVLLVEDNLINQKVAGKFLSNWTIAFDTAEHGQAALEMVQQKQYHLILMDLQMPVMDGYEATRRIRQLPAYAEVPIIALTAAGSPGSKPEMQQAGLTDVIFKPFQPEELLEQLKLHQIPHQEQEASSTTAETLSLGTLDLTDVLEIAAEDQAFLNELLQLYLQQFNEVVPDLKEKIGQHDIVGLRRILHKIKPSLALLRQSALHQLAQDVHEMLHEQAISPTELHAAFQPLIKGFQQLQQLLEHACETHVKTA